MDISSTAMDAVKAAAEQVASSMPTEVMAGSVGVSVRDATAPLKYTLAVGWKYTHCGVEMGRCGNVRTAMHLAIAEALFDAGVRYSWPTSVVQGTRVNFVTSGGGGVDDEQRQQEQGGLRSEPSIDTVAAAVSSTQAEGVTISGVTWPPSSSNTNTTTKKNA